MTFEPGIPNIRVIIREAADDNLTLDVPNISVKLEQGAQYNVNVTPNNVSALRTGSFTSYADAAGFAQTASYALVAQTLIGSIESASFAYTASFALTASYVSSAASTWDTIADKPDGLVSSSIQVLNYNIFATTSSNIFVGDQTISGSLTLEGGAVLLPNYQGQSGSIDLKAGPGGGWAELQSNNEAQYIWVDDTGAYIGTNYDTASRAWVFGRNGTLALPSGVGDITKDGVSVLTTGSLYGTASWARNATTASYALTASYVSGAASTWDTIANKPNGLVSSSAQAVTWTVATASLALNAVTASYFSGSIAFNDGLGVTGSIIATGGFTGSLFGTSSIASGLVKQTISISSSIIPAFTPITSGSQHLTDGVYTISSVLNSPNLINYRIAGTFAWSTATPLMDEIDEIFLHRVGQSASSASIFMRTRAVSGSTLTLQIGSDYVLSTGSYTFTLIKLL